MTASELERIARLETRIDDIIETVGKIDSKLTTIHESILMNRGYDKAVAKLVKIGFVVTPIALWAFGGQWRDMAHLFHIG